LNAAYKLITSRAT